MKTDLDANDPYDDIIVTRNGKQLPRNEWDSIPVDLLNIRSVRQGCSIRDTTDGVTVEIQHVLLARQTAGLPALIPVRPVGPTDNEVEIQRLKTAENVAERAIAAVVVLAICEAASRPRRKPWYKRLV